MSFPHSYSKRDKKENSSEIFGSDRSPRRGNLVYLSVHASVQDIMLRMALKEFLLHSQEPGNSRASR